jgi:hypothetical protein
LLDVYERAVSDTWDDDAIDAYLRALPTIGNPLAPDQAVRYLVEGDTALSAKEVREYLVGRSNAPQPADKVTKGDKTKDDNTELIVNVVKGEPTLWPPENRVLKYAVLKSTFSSEQNYTTVVADMAGAASDWQKACGSCAIKFEHVAALDSIATWDEYQTAAEAKKLTFVVMQNDSGGRFIASAFFPHEVWSRRVVSIDPTYFTLSGKLTRRGALRHELGHTLGYRHEHTRGVPGCYFEDNNWKALTGYDPKSVMHYFCGGADSKDRDLVITTTDEKGHTDLYGSP